jgi:hypothetical protein
MSTKSGNSFTGLLVSAENIQYFSEIDLGQLIDLPTKRADLVALSIRMDAAFSSLCELVREAIAQEYKAPPHAVLKVVISDLALNFIERYGALAFFSTGIVEILWNAQRPDWSKGPRLLSKVGQKLVIFSRSGRALRPKKTLDISFKLCKPAFLAELDGLSRELGRSGSVEPWADQLLGLVRMGGGYPMLKLNLTLLEQFLLSPETNPGLCARNAVSADLLAEYGIGKELGEKRKPCMTPDWFFYTWIAWSTNKTRSTVRRDIQTAETKLKKQIKHAPPGYKKTVI